MPESARDKAKRREEEHGREWQRAIAKHPFCPSCQQPLQPKPGERISEYVRRQSCSRRCLKGVLSIKAGGRNARAADGPNARSAPTPTLKATRLIDAFLRRPVPA